MLAGVVALAMWMVIGYLFAMVFLPLLFALD